MQVISTQFYFRARNSLGRIRSGDKLLIDTEIEITPGSIVLSDSDMTLQIAEAGAPSANYVGKVIEARLSISNPFPESVAERKKPLTLFSYEDTICDCPFCGNDNVHLQSVEVNAGGTVTTINHRLPTVTERSPNGRGTAISINFWAECGHAWNRKIYFYKGQTMEMLQEEAAGDYNEMWRD